MSVGRQSAHCLARRTSAQQNCSADMATASWHHLWWVDGASELGKTVVRPSGQSAADVAVGQVHQAGLALCGASKVHHSVRMRKDTVIVWSATRRQQTRCKTAALVSTALRQWTQNWRQQPACSCRERERAICFLQPWTHLECFRALGQRQHHWVQACNGGCEVSLPRRIRIQHAGAVARQTRQSNQDRS